MLNITKSHEPIVVNNVCIMIYGQPGIGKTSTAFTAKSCLLLDFDRGAYRSSFRSDSVQVDVWEDISDMAEKDLEPYDTVAVDTVGRLLDALTGYLIKSNPKLAHGSGALSLQGYGQLKAAYATWLKTLISYGKDVVLIAHDREDKSGETLMVRPDIQGASLGEVFKRADGVAYMYSSGRKRILDFNPTEKFSGKNSAGFDPIEVPNYASTGDFLADILNEIKLSLNQLSIEATEVMVAVEEWRATAEEVDSADAINDMIKASSDLAPPVGSQAKHIIAERAKSLGLKYDGAKGKGRYIEKEVAA